MMDMKPECPDMNVAAIESLITVDDLAMVLVTTRRTVDRMRSAGKIPKPDLHVGKMPRWRPETIRRWIDQQAETR